MVKRLLHTVMSKILPKSDSDGSKFSGSVARAATTSVHTGPKGDKGDTGADGADGATGATGPVGADGKTVLNGTAAPTTQGVVGDFFIDTTNDNIYGPKTSGGWGSATSLIGPQGATGPSGADGSDGAQGPAGADGSNGADGAQGPAGSDGADGVDAANATLYVQNFSGTGSATQFTLSQTPASENNTQVYISGVYQQKDTYSLSGTTLTFSEAPSSGADNIEVVTVATSSVGSTTSDLVTFSPSGTGATNRTTQAKLRDVVSVKDFGAQGDGTTDDSSAIIAAMAALASAGGGTLVFPAGTYIVESECDQGSCSAAFMYRGEGATIKCAASSLIYRMFDIRPNGHNFSMEGLEFDADSKARECVRVTEANQDSSTLLVRDCGFHNTTMSGSSSGNSGLVSLGGWDKVVVDNCSFTGHTRPQGSGNPGSAGTSGCIISASGSVYPRYVSVQNSIFEDITNGDSGTSTYNCDADGLKIMGATTTGSSYLYSSATVSNNIFRNCKGRSVKVQNDETAVIGNTFYRNILPKKGGSSEVNLQVGSGEVSSNKFHYDETSGSESPFDDGGSTDAGSWPISFYNSEEDSRPAMCTAANNTVYNNVTASVGALRSIVDFTGAVGDHSRVLTVSGNKATGKTDSFITATPEPSTGGAVHVHATDNFANEIGTAFLDLNGSGGYDKNFVTLTGNVNAGTAKPAAWYPGGSTVPNANYSVTNCVNLTEDSESTGYLKNRAPTTFASRIPAIAPDSSVGGLLSIQAATVADDATWNTSPRGYYGAFAVRVLSVGYSSATTAIFVDGSSTAAPTDLGNSGSSVVFISEGGTETDGKVNVWRNTTTGGVSIKNRLGSNRVFTLVTMG